MVLYVVLAVFMIGFILIQRGAGAAAGSGFGAGASATVFGARGAASFLTKATKWMAIAFFILTLGMAIYVQRTGLAGLRGPVGDDLGVMSGVAAPTGSDVPSAGAVDGVMSEAGEAGSDIPSAPIQQEQSEDADVPSLEAAPAEAEPERQDRSESEE